MIQEEIAQGDLLFHAVHGLCRVDEVDKQSQSGREVICYSLVPKVSNRMKVRFLIAGADMDASGFHVLISIKEANEILEYLKAQDRTALPPIREAKAGSPSPLPENQAWGLARAILSFSRPDLDIKDQRKRQMLDRSAKGLVRELALVLKMNLKETAAKVRKSLGDAPKINPSVLVALTRAGED